jgi:hypothetical protein
MHIPCWRQILLHHVVFAVMQSISQGSHVMHIFCNLILSSSSVCFYALVYNSLRGYCSNCFWGQKFHIFSLSEGI